MSTLSLAVFLEIAGAFKLFAPYTGRRLRLVVC